MQYFAMVCTHVHSEYVIFKMGPGLSYGKEKTREEENKRQTIEERGLAFACYQSSLEDGFEFV
jgi:hypothetical protein